MPDPKLQLPSLDTVQVMTYPGCYLPSLSGGRCVASGALRGWRKEVAGKVSLLALSAVR
jgi:hypothetical protein